MTRKVSVGETEVTVAPFRAYKAIKAGEIVARVSEEIPKLVDAMATFATEYEQKHKTRLTRDLAQARAAEIQAARAAEDDLPLAEQTVPRAASSWERLLEGPLKDREFIELPQEPSMEQRLVAVFPEAFKTARREVIELLALVVIPNAELRKAAGEDRVEETLQQIGSDLLFDADLGEMIELASVAVEVVREQIGGQREALGKLRGLISRTPMASSEVDEPPVSEEAPTTSSPTLSTPSPTPTGGPERKSSLESPSESLSPSGVA